LGIGEGKGAEFREGLAPQGYGYSLLRNALKQSIMGAKVASCEVKDEFRGNDEQNSLWRCFESYQGNT
jgi:uncharacterized membrane protein